jgi:hypothetical protein
MMVVPPPLGDLRRPAERWQTVSAATAPLAGKSMQNAAQCDIRATVAIQAGKSRPIVPRLFRNTEQCLRQFTGLSIIS